MENLSEIEFLLGINNIVDAYHIKFMDYGEVKQLYERLMGSKPDDIKGLTK
jgi:hypothetical protein